MKILYLCPYLPCSGINAGRNRMFELIKRLAVRNEVSVVSFVDKEDEGRVEKLKEICKKVDVMKKDYPWRANPLSNVPPMIDSYSSRPMQELVKKKLDEEDFDILHFEYLIMAQYAPDNCKALKFLTKHESHFLSQLKEMEIERSICNKIKMWGSALKKKIYEINICGKFDKIITMTDDEARILGAYYSALDVSSLAMGTDHKFFYPQDNGMEEDIDILFVGFFGHRPNVDAVGYFYREIFPLIQKKKRDANFTVIGFNPPDSILSLEADKTVRVIGYVDDIQPYLARTKVFVMPVRLGFGMRGKLFEAWAMGKPVVSTSAGCRGVAVKDGENILISDEPVDFAESVVALLANTEKRKRLGSNARRLVEKRYNWDGLAGRLEELYRKHMELDVSL